MEGVRVAIGRENQAGSADRLVDLGRTLRDLGRLDEALAPLREALRLDPDDPKALAILADVHTKRARPDDLVADCRALLAARPGHFEALHRMAEALVYLGQFEEALARFREAAGLVPASASVENGLGTSLAGLGRDDEAIAHFRRALTLDPDYPEAHHNLGLALARVGEADAGLAHLAEATWLRPGYVDAHHNRGVVLNRLRRFEEALGAYEQALAVRPDHVDAHTNRAMARLMLGDYARGWPEFAWRRRAPGGAVPHYARPAWRGEPLEGRTILLAGEQGIGDMIQFLRFAPIVKVRGATGVLVHAPAYLADLFSTCPGVDRVVAEVPEGADAPFDVYAPLMDLPALLGTTPETIPAPIPYLTPDPGRLLRWRDRLARFAGFRVGVVWQGNARNLMDPDRSFPLAGLEPLARVDGVRLVSLQKGAGSEQVREVADRFPVVDFGDDLDRGPGAFLDTAALMASLDLVISADTATAHLAGALGVPVWIPLSTAADWRWFPDREDSPWYPTARLFRQDRPRDWSPVFSRIAAALADLVAAKPPAASPVVVEIPAGELIDKITILEIKAERIDDTAKLANVRAELAHLESARDRSLPPLPSFAPIVAELRVVNEAIWDVEDALRLRERRGEFGPEFVELARSVYRNNDRRAELKRLLNDRLGSRLIEEKSYPDGCGPRRVG